MTNCCLQCDTHTLFFSICRCIFLGRINSKSSVPTQIELKRNWNVRNIEFQRLSFLFCAMSPAHVSRALWRWQQQQQQPTYYMPLSLQTRSIFALCSNEPNTTQMWAKIRTKCECVCVCISDGVFLAAKIKKSISKQNLFQLVITLSDLQAYSVSGDSFFFHSTMMAYSFKANTHDNGSICKWECDKKAEGSCKEEIRTHMCLQCVCFTTCALSHTTSMACRNWRILDSNHRKYATRCSLHQRVYEHGNSG